MASKVKYTPTESGSLALGQAGSKVISSGSDVEPDTGVFVAFYILDTVKFTTLTPEDSYFIDETDIGAATEVPMGSTIYGRWTSVNISQGKMIGYNG
jgi:hypothetical protein